MTECEVHCLLFVELESTHNSKKHVDSGVISGVSVKGNAGSSSAEVTPKVYALLPPSCEDPLISEILEQNDIERIVYSSPAPAQDVSLEVIEISFYVIPKSKQRDFSLDFDNGYVVREGRKLIRITCVYKNNKCVQQLFRKSSVVEFNELIYVLYDKAEIATSKASLKCIEAWLRHRGDLPVRHPKGGTLIHLAAKSCLEDLLKLLLTFGADINLPRDNGATPLHLAAGRRRKHRPISMVQLLLQNGAAVNVQTKEGVTPLHRAAKKGSSDIVKLLLAHGAKVDTRRSNGSTPLHIGVKANSMQIARMLIQAGADINTKTNDGLTPLHIAVGVGVTAAPLVEFLIRECGANVHTTDAIGRTPILCAAKTRPKVLQILVESGADINVQGNAGETLLYDTIVGGWPEALEYVLSLRPSVDNAGNQKAFYLALERDGDKYVKLVTQMISQGFVPTVGPDNAKNPNLFFGAIHKQLTEVVQALLNHGADVNQFHSFGGSNLSPLYLAVKTKNAGMVQLILDAGGDVNATRGPLHSLITPLSYAAEFSTAEVVQVLMAANPKDVADPRLLENAAAKADSHMIRFLLERGFDPNHVNVKGETPMSFAIRHGNLQAIEALLRFGVRCKLANLTSGKITNKEVMEAFLGHCFTDMSNDDEIAVRKILNIDPVNPRRNFFYLSGCAQILAQHLIKLEIAKELPITKKLISGRLAQKFKLDAFKSKSAPEIQMMKEDKIGSTDISLYDILTKDLGQIACYARNKKIAETLEAPMLKTKYPAYANILCRKFFEGKLRRIVLEEGMEAFKSLSKSARLPKLPDDMIMIVIDFLNNKDLLILQKFCSSN